MPITSIAKAKHTNEYPYHYLLEDYVEMMIAWMKRNGHWEAFANEYPHMEEVLYMKNGKFRNA